MWFFVESLFFINLVALVCPWLDRKAKKFWSITLYTVLAGCLLFLIFCGLKFVSILNITNLFYYSNHNYIKFGFPIVFILDNLTCIFCFLTLLLTVICLLVTWETPNYNSNFFLLLMWIFEFTLFHTFSSLNLLSFYVFFETSLIPMTFFILIWGSRQRKIHAMYVFFLYTVFGSVFLLFGSFYLYLITNTLLITNLTYLKLPLVSQILLWSFFFLGFGVKVPVVPVHTWLPEAHVEAPTIGSILLAGLLLKVGTFGMLRFMFPLFNEASNIFQPLVFIVSLVSIYHASLIALRQFDFKKAIAYSSIAHMGFVVIGLFSFNIYAFLGSLFIMFSHGIVASALFFLIGVIYERYKTRNILDYGGLANIMPNFSFFLFFFLLTNLSFPGTSNFIGELFTLIGLTEINYFISFFVTLSIILTSSYSIWIFNRVAYGPVDPKLIGFNDLNKIEFFVIFVSSLFVISLGFNPNLLLSSIDILPFFLFLN